MLSYKYNIEGALMYNVLFYRNENGRSDGGFDTEKDRWYANVYLKNGEKFHFENISHKKVALWLEQKRKEFDLK